MTNPFILLVGAIVVAIGFDVVISLLMGYLRVRIDW